MAGRRSIVYFGIVKNKASTTSASWVEDTFQKCECVQFMQDPHDPEKCGCGRDKSSHDPMVHWPVGHWTWSKHSVAFPTDSYGIVEFGTGVHAQYLRMSPSAKPQDVVSLLTEYWGAEPPKLLISIHGGMNNFDLPPRVRRAFRRSLQRMAAVPGAWIITTGLNVGVAKHVGDALTAGVLRRTRAVVIGIAPWGVIAGRHRLSVPNGNVHYYPPTNSSGVTTLNPNHSFFLLVDDGSVGKYGSEANWRRDFEQELSSTPSTSTQPGQNNNGNNPVSPLVAVLVEGGAHCIRVVVDYLNESKPVVIVEGSGRAADVLTLAMKYADAGLLVDPSKNQQHQVGSNNVNVSVRSSVASGATRPSLIGAAATSESEHILMLAIEQAFGQASDHRHQVLFKETILCTKRRRLVSIWAAPDIPVSMGLAANSPSGSHEDELDYCVLSALIRAKQRSAPEQLRLALAWDRVDLASSQSFTDAHQAWSEEAVTELMMEALIMDRVEFVKLLLERGINMHEVLTFSRLEHLYNIKHGDAFLLRDAVRLLAKRHMSAGRITMAEVGVTIDSLMGFGYRSPYKARSKEIGSLRSNGVLTSDAERFRYPFSELLIWAVLMQRQNLARLMCSKGEETLAKALVACRLYRSLAYALKTDVTPEIIEQLKENGREFATLAIEVVERCRQLDEVMAQQLLTYELQNFSQKTCLSLAVNARVKHLVAHSCCQNLLDVLWMGGLKTRSTRPWKILLGIFFPPYAIFGLEYLTQEELNLQPQTEAELEEQRQQAEDGGGSKSGGSGSASPSTAAYFSLEDGAVTGAGGHARVSRMQSLAPTNSSFRSSQRRNKRNQNAVSAIIPDDQLASTVPVQQSHQHEKLKKMHSSGELQQRHQSEQRESSERPQQRKQKTKESQQQQQELPTLAYNLQPLPEYDRMRSGSNVVAGEPKVSFLAMPIRSARTSSAGVLGAAPSSSMPRSPSIVGSNKAVFGRSRFSVMTDLENKFGGTPLDVRTRIAEFYNAPVTKFWLHTMGYLLFMLCFCESILTRSSLHYIDWFELYTTVYIFTLLFDKFREIATIDCSGFMTRLEIYFSDIWNIFDATGIGLFVIGELLRWFDETYEASRAFWICSIVFFVIHTFDIFQAHQGLATYIMIIQKMFKRMISFLIILGVVVGCYGIVLQATRFPYREPTWDILKDIWVEPYFNLYGEVYHEYIDTGQCDPDFKNSTSRDKPPCWCCTWIGPLAQAFYMIVANVLMLNLLVAVFNNVFDKINAVSKALTRFQRYRLIVDYQMLPVLPPPLIVLSHAFIIGHALVRSLQGRQFLARDPGLLKVVLDEGDLHQMHDFEEQARDELLEQREAIASRPSADEQARTTADRIEAVQLAVEQIVQRQSAVLAIMRDFEAKFGGAGGQSVGSPLSATTPVTQSDLISPFKFPPQTSTTSSVLAPITILSPTSSELSMAPAAAMSPSVTPSADLTMARNSSSSNIIQQQQQQVPTIVEEHSSDAEESTRRAFGKQLFRRLRAVSTSEDDAEFSLAARNVLAVRDIDEQSSMVPSEQGTEELESEHNMAVEDGDGDGDSPRTAQPSRQNSSRLTMMTVSPSSTKQSLSTQSSLTSAVAVMGRRLDAAAATAVGSDSAASFNKASKAVFGSEQHLSPSSSSSAISSSSPRADIITSQQQTATTISGKKDDASEDAANDETVEVVHF